MALQKKVVKEVFGIEVPFEKAYVQVTRISGDKEFLEFYLSVYDTEAKENLIETRIYSFVPSIEDDATNFYKQIYTYAKTLPEYEDAIDVLEPGQSVE